jgi:dihydrofolate reductase
MINNIPVTIVASMGRQTRVIGNNNQLLWHVPADMRRFKELTIGKPVIMGRKTFESIVAIIGKPLPNRTNIVITRQTGYVAPEGVRVVPSLEEAFEVAATGNPTEIHIGGGAELYRQALHLVDRLHITWFESDATGDTTFPEFETDFTIVQAHEPQLREGLKYQWIDYKRK